jgi:cobalt-zinc-cadmium efflux system outer membrane protein
LKLENTVRLKLNLDPTEEIILQLGDENPASHDLVELMKNARENRPEFRALLLLREQAGEQINLEEKRIWDDVLVQGGFSRQERVGARPGDPTSPNLPGAWSWIVGVVIPIPVFDRNQGTIMTAKIQQNQVEVRAHYFEKELEKTINDSLRSLDIQTKAIALYKNEQLKNAKSVRDSALRQFGSGASTLIEYLDAVGAYHNTISGYLNAQYELNVETIRLKHLSGLPL